MSRSSKILSLVILVQFVGLVIVTALYFQLRFQVADEKAQRDEVEALYEARRQEDIEKQVERIRRLVEEIDRDQRK